MSDYIDREAAIECVIHQYCASSDETENALGEAIEEIKALPSADVKPELPPMFDDEDIEEIRIIVHAYIERLCNAGRHKDAVETEKSLDKFIYLAKSADVKPVVRCRECKFFVDEGMYCENNIITMFDHFYCYYGELRCNDNDD